ncbi:DNA-binding response regulator [Sphaerisporangium krabiense]|uniref:NarL family two-component system response regulator LiaR n=1 Tax=Sphaerisporangium krabiense TaxID=763782 RepID=A0A7W9DSV1_9ACTN|nr:response regulator transcription factor [Sphaerisporangium krabiense]MBB5630112.1 NarL family two-component system response regulator LiaR [Sphaerisporangium krabiense]GII65060.1 DNA-binding response regulator [Sphaerisporangium krabiense]
MIRVLIVDDHEVVRQGLRFVLEQEEGIEVVGESKDGAHALAAVRALEPSVMLLDMVMPGMDGLEVLRRLGPDRPAVIVLTSFQEDERVVAAVRLGALSYLPKTTAVDRVVEAVRAAARGGSVLEPGIAALLVRQVRRGDPRGRLDALTPREREVLTELARGRSNGEIARSLSLGKETVKTHVSSVLAKLGVADRTQAAIVGLQHGLVPLEEALDGDAAE